MGVAVGMPLAEAVAIVGDDAVTQPHDCETDATELQALALRCRAFSPICGIESEDGILLDLLGCTHLFGTDRRVAEAAVRTLAGLGLDARAGVGATVGIAWAAARAASPALPYVVEDEQAEQWLDQQPVESLRLSTETLDGLASFDLHRVGQLRRLSRESLPSRFGEMLLHRLDQASGQVAEAVRPLLPKERLSRRWSGEYAIRSPKIAQEIACRLITELVARLPKGVGLVGVDVRFEEERPKPATPPVEVRLTKPTGSPDRITDLFDLTLERTRLPREIYAIEVVAGEVLRLAEAPVDLFGQPLEGDDEFGRLVEKLSSRLGADRVCRAESTGEVLPERTVCWVPVLDDTSRGSRSRPTTAGGTTSADTCATAELPEQARPTLLLRPPRPVDVHVVDDSPDIVRWERQREPVRHAWGPERIETGWWLDDDACGSGERRRDYWRTELQSGACLWLYRDLRTGRWWHHGTF